MARAIDQFLAAIRQAIYGRDVREAIASGIEQCYNDSTASAQKADIEAKGAEVLASIPDTYEDLQTDVDDLKSAIPYKDIELAWTAGYYRKKTDGVVTSRAYAAGTEDYYPVKHMPTTFIWSGSDTGPNDKDFTVIVHEFDANYDRIGVGHDLKIAGDASTIWHCVSSECRYVQFFVIYSDTTVTVDSTYFEYFAVASVFENMYDSAKEIGRLYNMTDLLANVEWENGNINSSGVEASSSKRIRTKTLTPFSVPSVLVDVDQGYRATVVCYDVNGSWLSTSNWITEKTTYTLYDNTSAVRVVMGEYPEVDTDVSISGHVHLYGNCAEKQADSAVRTWANSHIPCDELPLIWTAKYYRNASAGSQQTRDYAAGTQVYYPVVGNNRIFLWTGTLNSPNGKAYSAYIHEFDENKVWKRAKGIITGDKHAVYNGVRVGDDCRYVQFFVIYSDTSVVIDSTYFSLYSVGTYFGKFYENIDDPLPDYWRTYLATRIPEIQTQLTASTYGDNLIFFSDYHQRFNANYSPEIMKRIADMCGIEKIIFGGDLLDGMNQETQADVYADINKGLALFSPILDKLYMVVGNHERGGYANPDEGEDQHPSSTNFMPFDGLYAVFGKRRESKIGWADKYGNYWVDNEAQKIRYFFAISSASRRLYKKQRDSLTNEMKNTPSDYVIVLVSHFGLKYDANDNVIIYDEGETYAHYNSLFTTLDELNQAGTITMACALTGHSHYDISKTMTSGFPIIGIQMDSCDHYGDTGIVDYQTQMTRGTTTEQCFDVVSIDTANRTVKCYRIGAGTDRTTYTY